VPIGVTGGNSLSFDLIDRGGIQSVGLDELRTEHEGFLPKLMGRELTPEF